MKKIMGVLVILSLCSFLVGCGEKQETTSNVETEPATQTQAQTIEDKVNVEPATGAEVDTEEIEALMEEAKTNEEVAAQLEEAQKAAEEIELYSDDTKYVFKPTSNSTGIFYHNGSEITGYEVRIDYETHELAELAKQQLELEKEEDNIQSISVKGSELVVEYAPAEYEGTTLEEIQQAYATLQVLKEN